MTSLQIEYFLHLCRTGSFSETARQLFVAQPAVSKQIAALEREVGFSLFQRTNRGVTLTPGGVELQACLTQCQQSYHQALVRARRAMEGQHSHLALGVLENLGLDELDGVLARLRQQLPDLELSLMRLDNATLLERLSEGRLDAAITFDHAMEQRTGVDYVELVLEQSMFVISREHPLARREDLTLQDLSGQIICQPLGRDNNSTDPYLQRLLHRLGIQPVGYLRVDNLASGLAAVETNLAVGLIDERIQLLHPERYRLIPSGTYQSVVCAFLSGHRTREQELLLQLLGEVFPTA